MDVNVVDREGKPVEGYGKGRLQVVGDGASRKIQTVRSFTQVQPPPAAAAEPRGAARLVNVQAGRGRLFMLIFRRDHITLAMTRALTSRSEKFFSSLGRATA